MKFAKPVVTVDVVLFAYSRQSLRVLLVQRKHEPFKGKWVLPGGFIGDKESLVNSAKRELYEETGVKDVYVEQLYTFGGVGRDPRGRVITVAHVGLVDYSRVKVKAGSDAKRVKWYSVTSLPKLGFDHKEIVDMALIRLRKKLEKVGFDLMPSRFTLTELQKMHEVVLAKELDKRNFRKRLFMLDTVKATSETKMEGAHRPARLYGKRKK